MPGRLESSLNSSDYTALHEWARETYSGWSAVCAASRNPLGRRWSRGIFDDKIYNRPLFILPPGHQIEQKSNDRIPRALQTLTTTQIYQRLRHYQYQLDGSIQLCLWLQVRWWLQVLYVDLLVILEEQCWPQRQRSSFTRHILIWYEHVTPTDLRHEKKSPAF